MGKNVVIKVVSGVVLGVAALYLYTTYQNWREENRRFYDNDFQLKMLANDERAYEWRRLAKEKAKELTGAETLPDSAYASLKQEISDILAGKSPESYDIGGMALRIGDKAEIREWGFVDVMNLDFVFDDHGYLVVSKRFRDNGDFDVCGTPRGTIEILGFTKNRKALVEYTTSKDGGGSACESGVQYLIPVEEFLSLMTDKHTGDAETACGKRTAVYGQQESADHSFLSGLVAQTQRRYDFHEQIAKQRLRAATIPYVQRGFSNHRVC